MPQAVMPTKQDFPYVARARAGRMLAMRTYAAGGIGSGSGCGGRYQMSPCCPVSA